MDNNYLFDGMGDETVTFDNNAQYDLFNQYQNLPTVPQPNYANNESPFTSNITATPAAIRTANTSRSDNCLKNRLFGVGTNGGFLTSPVVKGHNRGLSGIENNPAIVDFSSYNQGGMMNNSYDINLQQTTLNFDTEENAFPVSTYQQSGGYYQAPVSAPSPAPAQAVTSSRAASQPQQSGLGMAGLDMADYAGANMRIYGVPIDQNKSPASQRAAPLGFLPYPDHLPTTTLGRGKKNARDVGPLDMPKPRSPNPACSRPQSPTQKPKNKKQLTVRTASVASPKVNKTPRKAVSSPCLNSRKVAPHHYPMTPSQNSNFDPSTLGFLNFDPIAPFNTPAQHGQTPQPVSEPFSFADLYNLGLVEGGPMDFSSMMEKAQGNNLPLPLDDLFSPPLSAVSSNQSNNLDDYAFLQSLPTPALVGGSGFSSPASTWDASPAMSPAVSVASSHHQQNQFSLEALQQEFASPTLSPAFSNASMHEQFNLDAMFSPVMPDFNAVLDPSLMDPNMQMQQMSQLPDLPRSRPSPSGMQHPWEQAYQPQQQMQQLPPQMPNFLSVDPYAAQPKPARRQASLNRKRSRDDFDADQTEDEDEDDEYVPQDMPSPQSKKARTVSAPVVGRRLKPGPKPKAKASCDNLAQQARSTSSGPPPSQLLAQALAQVNTEAGTGHDHSQCGSDCEEETAGLPKSVIRSLYQPLPQQQGQTGKKYVCLIEGCGRIFPRKSAIESHIQTHLEDKPFVCSHDDWSVALLFTVVHELILPCLSNAAFVRMVSFWTLTSKPGRLVLTSL